MNRSPLFMPRNEEEIMRTIIALDKQLKYVNDKPQINIVFDEQTQENLYFTIIVVRILKGEPSISALLKPSSFFQYYHDRSRNMGFIRKKYPKEATVFRIKFSKENFYRSDGAIDLYKARLNIVEELTRWLGNFRDYNGGTLKKQKELLTLIKKELKEDDLLVENFFYSLVPVVIRSILEKEAFITLYKLLFEDKEMYFDGRFTYIIMKSKDRHELEEKAYTLYENYQQGTDLIQGFMKMQDCYCMAYIYRSQDLALQGKFQSQVNTHLTQKGQNEGARGFEESIDSKSAAILY